MFEQLSLRTFLRRNNFINFRMLNTSIVLITIDKNLNMESQNLERFGL